MSGELNHRQLFHSGRRPSAGTAATLEAFCSMWEAVATEEGAEAEAEAAARGRGKGGPDHRSDSCAPCVATTDAEATDQCVGLQRCWGCPSSKKSLPKPRKASELVQPRAKRTQRKHGRTSPRAPPSLVLPPPSAGALRSSHRRLGCSSYTDARATRPARGQPQSPSHASSRHARLLVSGRTRVPVGR